MDNRQEYFYRIPFNAAISTCVPKQYTSRIDPPRQRVNPTKQSLFQSKILVRPLTLFCLFPKFLFLWGMLL
jgi:hypothetical protein